MSDFLEVTQTKHERVARIRTSDSIRFKACRRQWAWESALRRNLDPIETSDPLWTGTGFHFAMEDYHGHRVFESPRQAFERFVKACKKSRSVQMPPYWEEDTELACAMLDYYPLWLENRDPYETYCVDGVPQVEVRFEINLPISHPSWDRVVYQGTIDRVVIDQHNRLWPLDFKTAKVFQTMHLDLDPQISRYCWAASVLYDLPIAGFIYQQHKKLIPDYPKPLKSTGRISTAANQSTSRILYKKALLDLHGSMGRVPPENMEFLNNLSAQENDMHDAFIRRDLAYRNEHQIAAEGEKILLEAEDMLNEDLPLYPNPTRDCSWRCPFQTACISMDDGSDWEHELQSLSKPRERTDDSWRSLLQIPGAERSLPPSLEVDRSLE